MPGVLELLPGEQIEFSRMLDTIRSGFERFGFLPIETPAIELSEVLLTKTGGETERQVYFVQSTGSRRQGEEPDLALRFDLTVPLARYVAEHEQRLDFPFRRYQCQPVYRGESAQRGRFREFYQCDIDIIGRESLDLRHDAEVVAVISDVFGRLGMGDFTVRLNHRRLMRGILVSGGVVEPDRQAAVLREIDKLERRGPEAVAATLADLGVDPGLLTIVGRRSGSLDEARAILGEIPGDNAEVEEGRRQLLTVLETIAALGVPENHYRLDLSVARGLDYYTGTVYETSLDAHPEIGSICSGGRYDDLASHYTESRLPGVGISIGLTRLFWQLREIGLVSSSASKVDVLVTLMDEEGLAYSLDVAARLRQAGFNVEAMLDPSKLGRQLKRADRAGIPLVVIAGEDERSRSMVTLKNMKTQNQEQVAVADIVAAVGRSKDAIG